MEQLEEYYLTKKTLPPPDALPPREMKEKNPNWLKRRHSMGKQPPGLQRIISFLFFLRLNFFNN